MKTYAIDVSAEATIVSPTYVIKAKTEDEAYQKACKRFNRVIQKIEDAKSFRCQPSEINLYTVQELPDLKT